MTKFVYLVSLESEVKGFLSEDYEPLWKYVHDN